jgi:hypothetical protein
MYKEASVLVILYWQQGFQQYFLKECILLDAFPHSAGDHLAQNFLRKI